MKVQKFRKKPVEIEAIQLTNRITPEEAAEWCSGRVVDGPHTGGPIFIEIDTLEGVMTAGFNDWIIKGVKGEFYPCKEDIFGMTYEEAE